MSKKKILFCSEASWLSTGYSVYTKEVLSRLKDVEDIEVAELACYAAIEDVEGRNIPWQVYPNKPSPNDPALQSYNGNPSAQFGEQSFNQVLLHYQPDIVIDIRDWWMMEYQQRSPFRDFFHWAIMPTVDATPQADQWINTYASADAVFAYSEFGRDTLLSQCRDIKFVDTASPSASNIFMPYGDKAAHKASMELSENVLILGTVMRNQKRKLYPDLFESFRKFLDEVKDPNIYLLCHTYYPDVGWEIPKFLNEFGLSSRVLFTYKCKNCGKISVNFFQDSVQHCRHCNEFTSQMVGINNPIDENELASVYNLFDIYVQYANSEGFGMPQLEAAQCSVPVISTYYSAMQSIVDNIDAIGIQPLSYYIECETGCKRAIPDNNKFVEELVKLYHSRAQLPELGAEMRNNALDYYNWDKTAEAWLKHIMRVKPKDPQETWLSPPKILQPATTIPPEIGSMVDKVNYLFHNTLHKPEWIGSYLWKKVLKDCTFGYRCENVQKDFYFNESHVQAQQGNQAFSIDDAIKELAFFREQINEWEKARYEKVSSMGGRQ
jgi:glycosyltransferase involved in cell wall biosynthesis